MNNRAPFLLSRRDDLETACARLAALHAPLLPLVRAAADGRLNMMHITDPSAPWPGGAVKKSKRPVAVVIGADPGDGSADVLPTDWKCARHLRKWCAAAMVHGAGGEPVHYRTAAVMAEAAGRFVLVECSSAAAPIWSDFLQCSRTLVIVPRDGVHPLPARVQ